MIVDARVHGGIARGIGQALPQGCSHDANGHLIPACDMDHAAPRADDLPFCAVVQSPCTPCTHDPLGARGAGAARATGSPRAVVHAAIDAPHSGGHTIGHIDMPLSPARVRAAMTAQRRLSSTHSTSPAPRPSPPPSRRWAMTARRRWAAGSR